MAYIKTLKNNEIVGGTDNTDVYPVTSTQAIYSQDSSGNVRTRDGRPEKLEDRLNGLQEKVEGKGLSTNDYTNEEKQKLAGLHNYDDTQVRTLIQQTADNFTNYYTKSETYSQSQVDQLLRTQREGQYVPVNALPTASAETMFKIYLVPSSDPQTSNIKDEYITIDNGSEATTRYTWEKIGSTDVDLSGYSTTEEMNAAIANAVENCAYIEQSASTAVIADFDPQTDTIWKKPQVLSAAEKQQVQENIGVKDLVESYVNPLSIKDTYDSGKNIFTVKGFSFSRNGGFVNNNGTISTRGAGNAYYCGTTNYIDVSLISKIEIRNLLVQQPNTMLVVAYDENKNVIIGNSIESEYTSWTAITSLAWEKTNSSVKYIRITVRLYDRDELVTTCYAVDDNIVTTKGYIKEVFGFYNKNKLQSAVFEDNTFYHIVLSENIAFTQNVTLPKRCLLDFNGYYIDTSNYSLISPEGCIAEIIANKSYGYCLRGNRISGKFKAVNGLYFSNIWDTPQIASSNAANYINKVKVIFDSFVKTQIYLDVDILKPTSAVVDNDLIVSPQDVELVSLDIQRSFILLKGLTLNSGLLKLTNIKIDAYYGGSLNITGGSIVIDKVTQIKKNNIHLSTANNKILNSTIAGQIKLYVGNNEIRNNTISTDSDKYPLTVQSSNNIIERNTIESGKVGILISPNANSKIIENNVIKDNTITNSSEESISFDWIQNAGHRNIFKFSNIVSGTVVSGTLKGAADDYTSYIGCALYGISENSIGKVAKIVNIEDTETEDVINITLDKIIFEDDIVDGQTVFNIDGALNSKGYVDYRNTLWVIGSAYIGNLCCGNIINGGWSLNIYGAAFYNILKNNIVNTNSITSTGGIYLGAPSVTKNNTTFNAPICRNICCDNIVMNSRFASYYSDETLSEDCINDSVRYNTYSNNISLSLYISDKYSYVDTSNITERRTNPPYDYNASLFKHPGYNVTPLLYSSNTPKLQLRGRTILVNDSGGYKLFNGKFSDNYAQQPVLEDLVDNT